MPLAGCTGPAGTTEWPRTAEVSPVDTVSDIWGVGILSDPTI